MKMNECLLYDHDLIQTIDELEKRKKGEIQETEKELWIVSDSYKTDSVMKMVIETIPNYLPSFLTLGILAQEASDQPVFKDVSQAIAWLNVEVEETDSVVYYAILKTYWFFLLLGFLSPRDLPKTLKKLCLHMFLLESVLMLTLDALVIFFNCGYAPGMVSDCLHRSTINVYISSFIFGLGSFIISAIFCKFFANCSEVLFYGYVYFASLGFLVLWAYITWIFPSGEGFAWNLAFSCFNKFITDIFRPMISWYLWRWRTGIFCFCCWFCYDKQKPVLRITNASGDLTQH